MATITASQWRFSPFDLLDEAAPLVTGAPHLDDEEQLPNYDSTASAPAYDADPRTNTTGAPLQVYYLRQIDRKMQMLVPYGTSASASYKAVARSARFFSKKPELEVWRTMRTAGSSNDEGQRTASIWFDVDGPLPWRPRAQVVHHGPHDSTRECAMESNDFAKWRLDVDGVAYEWSLETRGTSMSFAPSDDPATVIARFRFSVCGTMASGGAEAGELVILAHALTEDPVGSAVFVEKILCALLVAIAQFRKMGRHYCSEHVQRGSSISGGSIPRTMSMADGERGSRMEGGGAGTAGMSTL